MHNALSLVKRQMHYFSVYPAQMAGEPFERLHAARIAAGYETASLAAAAIGVPISSYIQHENGSRGISKTQAVRYARFFKTTPEWLLYARTSGGDLSVNDLEAMIESVLGELVTFETRLGDLPRIVAPSLYEQLERFRVDRAARPDAPGSQSLASTTRVAKATSRNS